MKTHGFRALVTAALATLLLFAASSPCPAAASGNTDRPLRLIYNMECTEFLIGT